MNPFTEIYNRPEIASHYLSCVLQPAEALLLHAITARGGGVEMLDLGVGAGRTSFFFLPFVRRYTGIDTARRMIDLCRERFHDQPGAATSFRVEDASALHSCADSSFDAVLFSCNGIDCLDAGRRVDCLREVFRVLRHGGLFLFSSHNVQAIEACFGGRSPVAATLDPARRAAIHRCNEPLASYASRDAALFWDGVYGDDGSLKHFYVKPRAQVRALRDHGFTGIRVISSETARDLAEADLDGSTELALHYWCGKAPHPDGAAA